MITLSILLALLAFLPIKARTSKNLESYTITKLKKFGVMGASVVLIKKGKVHKIINCGYADSETGRPVTNETLFQIASLSKIITGTAVMQLAEEGLIDLDDNVSAYLPFPIVHPEFPDCPITARMLLSHTSGIEEELNQYKRLYTHETGGGDSPYTLEETICNFLDPEGEWYMEGASYTEFVPGKQYIYSNLGYALLGYLVEQVTGKSFPEYCREHIFTPLGMDHTAWHLTDTDLSLLAYPYKHGTEKLPFYSYATYPDGTLKTSSLEYAKFLISFMTDEALLHEETKAEMLKPRKRKQALTWIYQPFRDMRMPFVGKDTVGHSGGDPGIFTFTAINPINASGLILFTTSSPKVSLNLPGFQKALRMLSKEAGLC